MSIQDLIYIFTSSFIALFPVMNPIGGGFIVNGFLQDLDDAERKTINKKIIRNCLLIGLGSLAMGHLVLLIFGLAVPVIQIGGGIIICKTAWEWLSESSSPTPDKDKEKVISKLSASDIEGKLFYPISFPTTIGPGSISVIFALMASASVKGNILQTGVHYAIIALVIIALCGILYIFLSQGTKMLKKIGKNGSLVINKLIAFITFCIGIQIFLNGISKAFHITVL